MCVICVKKKGIDMPSETEILDMWDRNSDGAGIAWTEPSKDKVQVAKGFMDFSQFNGFLRDLGERVNLKEESVILHFRITTHGGTRPANCHPFPVSNSVERLKALEYEDELVMAHNGILSDYTPNAKLNKHNLSDTMTFIKECVAPLRQLSEDFIENKYIRQMLGHLIDGDKLAFISKSGIQLVGAFQESDGLYYSNLHHQYYYGSQYYKKKGNNNAVSGYNFPPDPIEPLPPRFQNRAQFYAGYEGIDDINEFYFDTVALEWEDYEFLTEQYETELDNVVTNVVETIPSEDANKRSNRMLEFYTDWSCVLNLIADYEIYSMDYGHEETTSAKFWNETYASLVNYQI